MSGEAAHDRVSLAFESLRACVETPDERLMAIKAAMRWRASLEHIRDVLTIADSAGMAGGRERRMLHVAREALEQVS